MGAKFCPKRGDTDLIMVAAGEIGMWECKKCGFKGSIFPERELIVNKSKKVNKK